MGKANSANATTTITESNNQQEKIQITRASLDTTVVYTTHRSKIFSYGNAQIRIFSYANSASLHETKITVTNGIASHKWCSIAYDGQRYLYVFGGISDELRGTVNKHGQRNNLYCYDFTSGTWSCLDEHCPTRPLARNSGTLLYRESAHSLIVFGGYHNDWLTSMFEFSLMSKQWKKLPVDAQVIKRTQTCGAYRSKYDSVVYFGGYTGTSYLNDLDEYNCTTQKWYKHSVPDFVLARYACCAIAPDNERLIVAGGLDSNSAQVKGICEYNFITKQWCSYEGDVIKVTCMAVIPPNTLMVLDTQTTDYNERQVVIDNVAPEQDWTIKLFKQLQLHQWTNVTFYFQ